MGSCGKLAPSTTFVEVSACRSSRHGFQDHFKQCNTCWRHYRVSASDCRLHDTFPSMLRQQGAMQCFANFCLRTPPPQPLQDRLHRLLILQPPHLWQVAAVLNQEIASPPATRMQSTSVSAWNLPCLQHTMLRRLAKAEAIPEKMVTDELQARRQDAGLWQSSTSVSMLIYMLRRSAGACSFKRSGHSIRQMPVDRADPKSRRPRSSWPLSLYRSK